MQDIKYAAEPDLSVEEFRLLLVDSGLGARRPVDDVERLGHMLRHADLIIAARRNRALVGVARSLTDQVYCCYLSDLAVAKAVQGGGIGKALIEETRKHLGPKVSVILAAAPEAVGFYEAIEMPRLLDCFWYRRSA
ncbi:MAG: GNAT family N-acetyltransferase [Rhodospirillaceae bacterium]